MTAIKWRDTSALASSTRSSPVVATRPQRVSSSVSANTYSLMKHCRASAQKKAKLLVDGVHRLERLPAMGCTSSGDGLQVALRTGAVSRSACRTDAADPWPTRSFKGFAGALDDRSAGSLLMTQGGCQRRKLQPSRPQPSTRRERPAPGGLVEQGCRRGSFTHCTKYARLIGFADGKRARDVATLRRYRPWSSAPGRDYGRHRPGWD